MERDATAEGMAVLLLPICELLPKNTIKICFKISLNVNNLVSNAPVGRHATKLCRHTQLQYNCHLQHCAVSNPSISKTRPDPLMWRYKTQNAMKRWQRSNLTSRLLPTISSFHIFKSRTCRGIKGVQSRSSGFPLPPVRHLAPRPHRRASFHHRRIIHERHMPLIDKSPCVTTPPPPFLTSTNTLILIYGCRCYRFVHYIKKSCVSLVIPASSPHITTTSSSSSSR